MNTIIDTPETLPFWRSRIIMGALVSLLCKVLALTGLTGDLASDPAVIDALVIAISFLADAVIVRARIKQDVAPTITVGK